MNEKSLKEKTLLVTGGTGSFGKAFIRECLRTQDPKKAIVYSRDELKQSEMAQSMPDPRLRFFLGDVRDVDRLRRAMAGVDYVVHAAALKQVPACEYNPCEAAKTNIQGAMNVIEASIDAGVKKVLALSTDKAVNPVNLYGATKLVMEKIITQANTYSPYSTLFSCTRYGNVAGSRGSVVPVFKKQIQEGKTLTITDPRMTRFWLTLNQGVNFVLHCLLRMVGGEVFVPQLPSVNISELASEMAYGSNVAVKVTGIRSGEKLHECLLSQDEARHSLCTVDHCYVILPPQPFPRREWPTGVPLAEGFSYTSDKNYQWLAGTELKESLE